MTVRPRSLLKNFVCLSLLLPACIKKSSVSDAEHVFGETAVSRTDRIRSCRADAKSKKYPVATAYTKKLLSLILKANELSGAQALSNAPMESSFCVLLAEDESLGASSLPSSGLISVHLGALTQAKNDAMLAGILAHEVAHVRLNHGASDALIKYVTTEADKTAMQSLNAERRKVREQLERPFNEFERILPQAKIEADDDVFMAIHRLEKVTPAIFYETARPIVLQKKLCRRQCARWSVLADVVLEGFKKMSALDAKIETILSKYLTPEQMANETEAEADEAGLELYIRAGFEPSLYVAAFKESLHKSVGDTEYAKCLSQKPDDVPRGLDDHPTTCWRVLNIEKRELIEHKEDYIPFNKNLVNVITAPTLNEAQMEIEH